MPMYYNFLYKTLDYLIGIVFIILPVSCGKNEPSFADKVAERIEGEYTLTDIFWTGDPIDVNGDGISSNHLYQALMSLPANAQSLFVAEVLPFLPDHYDGVIGIQFPIQNSSATYDGKYPTGFITGGALSVSVRYQIDVEGRLSVDHFKSFGVPSTELRVEIKSMHDGTVSFDENYNLIFTAGYTFYDHLTVGLVSGVIRYTYKKIDS